MTNRLAELETYLATKHPTLRTQRRTDGGASPARSETHALRARAQGAGTRPRGAIRGTTRAFAAPVDYTVPGTVPALVQRGASTCWATVVAMMTSWKQNRSLEVGQVLDALGGPWRAKYDGDKGLLPSEKPAFLAAAGLVAEPPMNPSVDGWATLLRRYGPLWVTSDEAPGDAQWAIHARVLRGIHGDGTPAGTTVDVVDPADGLQHGELLATFQAKFEQEARVGSARAPLRLQIVHWPLETGVTVQQSLRSAQLTGPVEVIGLGVAIFDTGRTLATQGSLSYSAQEASHVFPYTPPDTPRKRSTMDFRICAHHPRYGIGTQHFYFRLEVEHNGHDILLSRISQLRDRSSTMVMSSFHASFVPKADPPVNNRATIRYLIDGQWDPVGRGDVAFRGELLIGPDGAATIDIESEQGWVYVEPNPWSNVQRVAMPTPKRASHATEIRTFRVGDATVPAGTEEKLRAWIASIPASARPAVAAGTLPVSITGYASTTGTREDNLRLTERRAKAVEAMVRPMLPNAKLDIESLGEHASGPDGVESPDWRRVRVEVVHFQ